MKAQISEVAVARRITLDFLRTEAASGAVLGLAALAALALANSPWSASYFAFLKADIPVQLGPIHLDESVSEWIKEGLMAVFFFVVGLEIKYEILRGELSDPRKLALPVLAAIGGMAAPALIYLAVAGALGGPSHGWSIPVATDIAFALAAFAIVGRGLPSSLRVFLLTLAIVDDLGAIAIIAAVFSQNLQLTMLAQAAAGLAIMAVVGRTRPSTVIWTLGFLWVWYFTFEAGLSTSLAGVAYALIVPIDARKPGEEGPLKAFMEALHPWVSFAILPLFAFAKAGFSFAGLSLDRLFSPLALAIAAGLFFGKQIGVAGAAGLAMALRLGARPSNATRAEMYGVSLLCGVGFTMSLFIGALAFPGAVDSPEQAEVKLGVFAGSLISALAGVIMLSGSARKRRRHRESQSVAITDDILVNIDPT